MGADGLLVSVELKAYIQGIYTSSGFMTAVSEPSGFPGICDTIILELHDASPPYALSQSTTGTIGINGIGNFTFSGFSIWKSNYLELSHIEML